MSSINIFRIDKDRINDFKENLGKICKTINKVSSINEQEINSILYVKNDPYIKNSLSWNWVLSEFGEQNIQKEKQAWAVMLVNVNECYYALTFGNAFYRVDKFADKDFAFSLGRKFDYKKIKSTAQTNPNSNRNKTVVSYLRNERFEYDSGESFIKIKGKIKLDEDFKLFGEDIEIGTSIKLNIGTPTIDQCINILFYLNDLSKQADVTKIPIFVKVKNAQLLEELDRQLERDLVNDNLDICFSDFDVIGTQEVFYSAAQKFTIKSNRRSKIIDTLSKDEIELFCKEKGLQYNEIILSLNIEVQTEDSSHEYTIKQLIDYTNEDKKCVLVKGEWYQYNDDYLAELDASMDEFDIDENPNFNWTNERYNQILDKKYDEEKDFSDYVGKSKEEVLGLLQKKYYSERAYNEYLANSLGYTLMDRKLEIINGHKIEVADLYKDECLYAVKIGNSSSKLCYAVDQIEASAKGIRKKELSFDKRINRVAIIFVLERAKPLPVLNGKIILSSLKLLVLKNRLNEWKNTMRHLGFEPEVFIGYSL